MLTAGCHPQTSKGRRIGRTPHEFRQLPRPQAGHISLVTSAQEALALINPIRWQGVSGSREEPRIGTDETRIRKRASRSLVREAWSKKATDNVDRPARVIKCAPAGYIERGRSGARERDAICAALKWRIARCELGRSGRAQRQMLPVSAIVVQANAAGGGCW
jgi:hypothetical protein